MIQAKETLLTRPVKMSLSWRASAMRATKVLAAISRERTPVTVPPRRPKKTAITVSRGTVAIIAHILGTATMRRGSRAMVRRASISSVNFMVAISAAIAEPLRPDTIIAVIRGPSSRVMPMARRSATKMLAPNWRSWAAA